MGNLVLIFVHLGATQMNTLFYKLKFLRALFWSINKLKSVKEYREFMVHLIVNENNN